MTENHVSSKEKTSIWCRKLILNWQYKCVMGQHKQITKMLHKSAFEHKNLLNGQHIWWWHPLLKQILHFIHQGAIWWWGPLVNKILHFLHPNLPITFQPTQDPVVHAITIRCCTMPHHNISHSATNSLDDTVWHRNAPYHSKSGEKKVLKT